MDSKENIEDLLSVLAGKDGVARQQARKDLVELGTIAVPFLIKALTNPHTRIRWEAAKALGTMRDPQAAPFLVQALSDKSFEVRWLAAEGLIALRRDSLQPLLTALIEHADNWDLRQGAHHILHAFERVDLLNEECLAVLDELRSLEAEFALPPAAKAALESLAKKKNNDV